MNLTVREGRAALISMQTDKEDSQTLLQIPLSSEGAVNWHLRVGLDLKQDFLVGNEVIKLL